MRKNIFYILCPLLLSGCVASWISGDTGYLSEDYPDIRTVPERPAACAPRGLHEGDEKLARASDFKKLEEDREQVKARNEALREGAFPEAEKVAEETKTKSTPDDKGGL